jgi:hypothetical protein
MDITESDMHQKEQDLLAYAKQLVKEKLMRAIDALDEDEDLSRVSAFLNDAQGAIEHIGKFIAFLHGED